MNNAKLSYEQMKEMIELFTRHRLQALRIGDFELQKTHYEPVVSSENNKASFQEDPSSQFPPEIQEYLASVQNLPVKK